MKKRYSLKKQHIILKLLQNKKTVGNKNYVIYYKETKDDLKIAISVSKKVGNAVERNYQKRVSRDIISKNIESLYGFSIVFVVKPTAVELDFKEKEKQINYLINKIINKKGENKIEK